MKSMLNFAFLAVHALTIALLVLLPKNNFKRVATLHVATLLTFIVMMLTPDKKIEDLMVGGLKIIQSDNLYRFTSDAVLLARFPKRKHKNVLDLCAGSGVVGLHYYGEFYCDSLSFVEIQPSLAKMCEESIELNSLTDMAKVENVNLKDYDGNCFFDAAFCNPPYKKQDSGFLACDEHIAKCRAEVDCTLFDIVACAARSLKYGGRFYMCHKPERLTDVLTCFRENNIEPVRLRFIAGKGKKDIYLFLIEGVKGKKPPLELEGVFVNDAVDFKG